MFCVAVFNHYLLWPRFMRAAQLPDDLEMILEDHRLSVSAMRTSVISFDSF